MKLKKLMITSLVSASMLGVGCTNGNRSSSSSNSSEIENSAMILNAGDEKKLDMVIFDDGVTDEIISSLVGKGADLIVGGLKTYGMRVAINLLKECGLDFRDITTKTLEAIQNQIAALETRIKAMAQRQEQIHSESILSPILKEIKETRNNYFSYIKGFDNLIKLEEENTLSEPEIESRRKQFYDDSISKLTINGNPFATFVSNLADWILMPNGSAPSNSIFDYYDNTLGVYDVWSTISIRSIREFIAYLDATLVTCANFAKYQLYYMAEGKGEETRLSYADMIDTMAGKVNAVNELFKAKIDSLKPLEDKRDAGINVYMATGKEYSRRMATLTYDVNQKTENDSRQGLLTGLHTYSDGTTKESSWRYAFEYVPDQNFVAQVAGDFKTYAGAFCSAEYTINDYLKYAGFYANNEELFNNAIGLYNANMYVDGHDFLNEDYDYTATYYDQRGEYTRKKIYDVDSYHNWNFDVDSTSFEQCDDSYYLCFATPKDDKQVLDGTYQKIYMKDVKYTVSNRLYYNLKEEDVSMTNYKGEWYLHDSW